MLPGARHALLCLLTAFAALLAPEMSAAATSNQPGAPCSSSTVSAVDQYCENIPSATGGNEAGPGTPAVGKSLPPSVVSALRGAGGSGPGGTSGGAPTLPVQGQASSATPASAPASGSAQTSGSAQSGSARTSGSAQTPASARTHAALLTLPAPGSRALLSGTTAHRPSSWSLFSVLIIALAAAALALSAVAFARRRRGNTA